MVFTDLPIVERVRRIDELGFQVEIWDWTRHDLDALVATGATFSSMTGYVSGNLTDPEGADELLASAERSIEVAAPLGVPRLNLHGTGLDEPRPAGDAGRGGHRRDVAGRRRDARPGRRAGRARGRHLLPGEPQHRGRPPRRAVRAGRGHPGPGRGAWTARSCG